MRGVVSLRGRYPNAHMLQVLFSSLPHLSVGKDVSKVSKHLS